MDKRRYMYEQIEDDKKTAQVTTTESIKHSPTKNFNRRRHNRNLFWSEVSWRFAGAFIFSVIITVILYTFSQKGTLSRWERRWFNVLTIFFSSLVSLSLGSLLGLLGNMLRWPLLARKAYKPMDIDLILGISNPTGALRLIWHHTMDWNWTATTMVVTIYLLVNIIGRLSVAAFGLTFDLNELPGIDYPVMVTDWSTDSWFNISAGSGYNLAAQHFRRMNDYAATGLSTVPTEFDSENSSNYTLTNSAGQGLDRKVEEEKVTYSYSLKEYRGLDVNSSESKVLSSSSKCIGRNLWGHDVYENGKIVGNIKETTPDSEAFLNILVGMYVFYDRALTDYLWAAPLDYSQLSDPSACATTYLYTEDYLSYTETHERNATYFECTTCLTDENNKPGIGSDVLFGLPSENSSITANLLLRFGPFERVFSDYAVDPSGSNGKQLSVRLYSGMNGNSHFLNNLQNYLHSGTIKGHPRIDVPAEAELYAAHLAARLPLLAIIGADIQLPKVTREKGASERPFVATSLEVRWKRANAVLVSIFVGQLVAIFVVSFMCRNVFLRDHDSYLSLARLMKTAMNRVEGRSMVRVKELVEHLEGKHVKMRYGTREKDGESYEVDLWHDVSNKFPDAHYE